MKPSRKPVKTTLLPDYRYSLLWNFGKSQCSFDTIKDLTDFIRDHLPLAESPAENI